MSAADSLQVQNHSNYAAPQIPTNCNGPTQKAEGKVGKDHTLNAAVRCLHMVFLCDAPMPKPNKDYTLLKLSFNAGCDFEHIHLPVDPMQATLSQHGDSQKFPYALGQTL